MTKLTESSNSGPLQDGASSHLVDNPRLARMTMYPGREDDKRAAAGPQMPDSIERDAASSETGGHRMDHF